MPDTLEQETAYLESIENSDKQIFLIAWSGDEIAGTCNYSGFTRERLAHRGEIGISVRKSMWGQHIGSLLIENIIELARDVAKAEILSLEVRSDNERAIALYKKYGFEKIGQFRGFMKIHGEYVDCDLMNLYL